jgi:hypothetical protein
MSLNAKIIFTVIVFVISAAFGYARSKRKESRHDDLSFLD